MNQVVPTSINSVGISTGNGSKIAPQNLGEVVRFAEVMSKADIAIPKHLRGNAGACMAVALQALEWEMSPFAVASKSYAVNGLIAYEAQLIAAVVNTRSSIEGRLKYSYSGEGSDLICTVTGTIDGDELTYTSPPMGQISPKNSPLWKTDPQQQLGYFSARSWARRHTPEVILGVYDREEAQQFHGPDNAKDVTPKSPVMERLEAAQEARDGEEGFRSEMGSPPEAENHANNGDETLAGAVDALSQPADEGGDSSPHTDPARSDPAKAGLTDGEVEKVSSAASPEVDRDWLSKISKLLVAEMQRDPPEVGALLGTLGEQKEGKNQATLDKARSISKYAQQCAAKEIEVSDAIDLIAGIAGVETGDIKP